MDRQKAKLIREILEDVFEANKDLFDDEKIVVRIGSGSFSNTQLNVKLEICDVGESGEVKSRDSESYKAMASLYGLPPHGTEFTFNGKKYRVDGFHGRRGKYPVTAVRSDGKKFKFGIDTIKRLCPAKKAKAGK